MLAGKSTSLDYSTDGEPGIARIARKGCVTFRSPSGREIRGVRTLKRIAALAIPPAWTDVWICNNPKGHIQAIGKDARGRKQYRYHLEWVAERHSSKFDSLYEFGRVLPRIRRRVNADLALPLLSKRRVLAAIVQLMDQVFIRVGGERYRRDNGSFGVTTLRSSHVRVAGSEVVLDFRGKSGKRHQLELDDTRVATVVRKCLDLPGATLFQYREGDAVRTISAGDVNEYLRLVSGSAITSKDFRTWGGTVCATRHLAKESRRATTSEKRGHVRQAVRAAAQLLGNTPAVCRKSYIHPLVLSNYERGMIAPSMHIEGLRAGERVVMGLLAHQRKVAARHPATTQASVGRG